MQGLYPQKTMSLSDLVHVGENVYSIEGTEVPAAVPLQMHTTVSSALTTDKERW